MSKEPPFLLQLLNNLKVLIFSISSSYSMISLSSFGQILYPSNIQTTFLFLKREWTDFVKNCLAFWNIHKGKILLVATCDLESFVINILFYFCCIKSCKVGLGRQAFAEKLRVCVSYRTTSYKSPGFRARPEETIDFLSQFFPTRHRFRCCKCRHSYSNAFRVEEPLIQTTDTRPAQLSERV